MRDIIITLMVFGAVPFVFMRPYYGVLLWCWLAYMNPHRLSWGFAYFMPFSAIAAAAVMLAMVFSKEPKWFPKNPALIVWGLFILWMGVSTVFAFNVESAFSGWKWVMKIQLMTLITLVLINDREKLNHLVWIITFSLGFFGVKGGAFTVLTGGSFKVWGPPETFVEGNNEIALALVMIIPLMRYIQLESDNKWVKRGMLLSMALSSAAVVASYSRGAFLAVGAMFFVFWLKSKRKAVIGSLMLLAAIAVATLMPSQWGERMGTISTYEEDESAMGRVNAWTFAYNLAADRPLVGGGFNAFSKKLFEVYAPNPEDFHDAHSIYFEVLGEHGFVGLGLFLIFWILVFRTGTWTIKRTKNKPELSWANNLAAMTQTSLIGYAVGGAFLGLAYYDLPYHLMTILVITRALVEKELAKEKETAAVPNKRANQFSMGRT